MMNISVKPKKTGAFFKPNRTLLASAIALSLGILTLPAAHAVLDIPPSPLQSGAGVAANLMYILDDSGSMHWEIMPDNFTYSEYLFPMPSHVYGGANYSDGNERIVAFDDSSNVNTLVRSWHNNKVHYNPSINYTPWVKYDGTSYGNSNPQLAGYNPYTRLVSPGTCNGTFDPNNQCIDLTSQQTYTRWNNTGSTHSNNFWPITFYQYNAGSIWNTTSYTKFQIRGNQGYSQNLNGGVETAVTSFTWPGGITRTVAEERQNFANWFTYYRSRILSVRGGTGLAFQGLNPKSFRVGFTTINNGGINYQIPITPSPIDGNFEGTYKENFYERLYQWPIPQSGTPLRRALRVVGDSYKNTTSGGPWAPDIGGGGLQVSCRQSFAILTTDGYWNGPNQGVGNEDGTDGAVITGPNSASFQYITDRPFKDSYSDTLADIAMKYWKADLRPEAFMKNDVPVSSADPAFWQHMSTFGVSLGANGTLDAKTDLPNMISGAKSWPDPFASYPAKIDDLWHASINGHGGFVAAQDPNEFAKALKDTLGTISDRVASASNISSNSTQVSTDSKIFQAKYTSGTWIGELVASNVTPSGVGSVAWTASSGLALSPATGRNIITWNGTAGIPFKFASLPAAAKTALDFDATAGNSNDDWIVEYLRGDTSKEQQNGGDFRNRIPHRLGDIVHSSPSYSKDSNTVFTGANDGMLHAFDVSNGQESFAYIPGSFLATGLKDLSSPSYNHRYFVDGQIAISTKIQTTNYNYLTVALGAGGKGLIGLDVTTPASFTTSNALWESASDANMGYVLGKPIIAKLNNGDWAVITGNGYNSTNERAVLYVINLTTGATIATLDTGAGSPTTTNGLSTPKGWDEDANGTVDYVYAGDLLGNMWKFDLSALLPASWSVANSGSPLFVAKDSSGKRQPITGGVAVALNPNATDPNFGKRFVMFGTGRYINHTDSTNLDVQTWYGLIDEGAAIADRSTGTLTSRTIETVVTASGKTYRTFTTPSAGDMAGKNGWYIDLKVTALPAKGERIVTDSIMYGKVLLASSAIPGVDNICSPSGSGFVNVIDPFTGGNVPKIFFDLNNDKKQTDADRIDPTDPNSKAVSSIDFGIGMPGEPLIVGDQLIVGGSTGGVGGIGIFPAFPQGRISWHEIKRD